MEDDYYYASGTRHVRGDPYRRSANFLNPNQHYSAGLHRSHSTGSRGDVPHINIYNTMDQDMRPRLDNRQAQRTPSTSPRGRPIFLEDEWALPDEQFRLRSRSRGRQGFEHFHHHDHHNHSGSTSPDYRTQMQLALAEERNREMQDRLKLEREEEHLRRKLELDLIRDRQERDEEEALMQRKLKLKLLQSKQEREEEEDRLRREEERIKEKYERKRLEDERKRAAEQKEIEEIKRRAVQEAKEREERDKEAKKKAAEEYQRKLEKQEKEAAEERKRIIADFERKKIEDAKKKKEEEDALIARLKKQEEDKKAREKREWEEFERKRKEKEEAAAAAKKKKEEELESDMRKRLSQFGFQENQIQAIIKPEKAKDLPVGLSPAYPLDPHHHHHHHHHQPSPTYVKVHRDHLCIETLEFYGLPWEWDRTDTDYIIILREMDPRETDILFEHTRRIRTKKTTETRLLIKERTDREGPPQYAWVRRRSKSKSPMRIRASSSPKRRVVGIGEMF